MIVKLNKILFSILVLILLIDPSDLIFHLKTPLFFLIIFFWVVDKILNKKKIKFNKDINTIVYVFLFIPVIGLISGIVQNDIVDFDFAAGIIKSFSIFFITILVIDMDIPIYQNVNWLSFCIPLIIIPIYFLFLLDQDYFSKAVNYLVEDKGEAAFAVRNFYGIEVVMMYYRTSALLVFPLGYFFSGFLTRRNFVFLILSFICFITLFLSGTRGNIVAGFLIFTYLIFNHMIRKKKYILILASCLIMLYGAVILFSNLSFQEKDESQTIKAGHMASYFKLFSNSPGTLLFGQGPGSKFFSSGINADILQSELTYLDLVRFFGIPLSLILIFILIYPILILYKKRLNRKYLPAIVAYYGYLFIVGTNPLLISSTGIVAVIIMYSFLGVKHDKLINNVNEPGYR